MPTITADELRSRIIQSQYNPYPNGNPPHIVEDIEQIVKAIKSRASLYWHLGQEIPGTDAVIVGVSLLTRCWSVCSKENFEKAQEISKNMLTNAGDGRRIG